MARRARWRDFSVLCYISPDPQYLEPAEALNSQACPRHDRAVVDGRYPVRQLVRLVQILGGEQNGSAGPDHLPHLVAAARVEPGGRLVPEQQLEPFSAKMDTS